MTNHLEDAVLLDQLFGLNGRVVVVTGAYGQLGRRYCRALTAVGAKVAALDRPSVVSEQEAPEDTFGVGADVTDRAALVDALNAVRANLGAPTGLVNNAAIDAPPDASADENGPFESFPEKSFDRVMEVNVKGVMMCCQVFGGDMASNSGGSIVNIGSIYGSVSPDQSIYEYRRKAGEEFFKPVSYSVSKSAIYNLTRYLATYWSTSQVRVNTLTLAGVYNGQDPSFLDAYLQKCPIGRMATPDDYVGPLVYLLSDSSRYMTGADLVVDGGWTAW